MERIQSGVSPDLLILDLPRGEADGLHFLRWLRRLRPELPIIAICDQDDASSAKKPCVWAPETASSGRWQGPAT